MNIIKADYYRSEGRLLNEDDDKVRVTLDMDRSEYRKFKNTLEPLSSDAVLSEVSALQEELAAFAHKQWSGWMKYLFSKCETMTGNYDKENREIVLTATIPSWACVRWSRQMQTEYDDLSEEEKSSDWKEAAGMIEIIRRHFI